MQRILIIRFSSFGDIIQCMSVIAPLKEKFPEAQIDFLTHRSFAPLLKCSPHINQVWSYDKETGIKGALELALGLKKVHYHRLYDAHRSLRSLLISAVIRNPLKVLLPGLFQSQNFISRSKSRFKRFLLFHSKPKINLFPKPFRGILSYLAPLKKWGIKNPRHQKANWNFSPQVLHQVDKELSLLKPDFIALAPSAAWEMKRWPLEHFKALIKQLPQMHFAILAGPSDHFCQELKAVAPDRVLNLAGKLNLVESCAVVSKASLLVSADTGLLHTADLLGVKGIALIGPTAFGHTTGQWIKEMSVDLKCRPCTKDGRGGCSQAIYQQCMVDIKPIEVAQEIKAQLK